MKSEYLQTLVESVSMGSFSKAAESLCVSQSAVSRRIQFLEEQYGCPLLDRSGPVLVPTDAGRMVLDKAGKILALEKELLLNLRGFAPKHGITFCCSPGFGISYLPEIMERFMLSHSNITELKYFFELPGKVLEGLREGIYQAGVVEHYEDLELSGFETFALPDNEIVFVSSPQLGLTGDEVAIDQLVQHDLYIRKEGCCSSKLLNFNMENIGRDRAEFSRTVVCDDMHLILSAISDGNGITFAPRSLVEKYLRNGVLSVHRVAGFNHNHHRTLIVSTPPSSDPLLADFVADIFAVLG